MRLHFLLLAAILYPVISFCQHIDTSGYLTIPTLERNIIDLFGKGELDAAIKITQEQIKNYEVLEEWENLVKANNFLANLYHSQREFPKFRAVASKAYQLAKSKLNLEGSISAQTINNFSVYHYGNGNYSKSIELLKEAEGIFKEEKVSLVEFARIYQNIGNYYKHSGDHENAAFYLRKALKIRLDSFPNQPRRLANSYQAIGEAFGDNNQIDSAITYLNIVKNLIIEIPASKIKKDLVINNYLYLIELWSLKYNEKKVNHYLDKVYSFELNPYNAVKVYDEHSKWLVLKKQYAKAIDLSIKAQEISDAHTVRYTPPLVAQRFLTLGEAYALSNNFQNALGAYQKAINILAIDFETDDFSSNPKENQFLAKPDALACLEGKADVLYQLFKKTNDSKYLKASYDTYLLATKLIQEIRMGYLNIDAKNNLSKKSVAIYEGAIKTSLNLFEQEQDPTFKAQALYFAESNKSLLLLENLNEQNAKSFTNIPDTLLEKEKDLKLFLALLKRDFLENNDKKTEEQIFNIQQELTQLSLFFEKNYPRYYELKYQNTPADLSTIQQNITPDAAMIEYFVGEQSIYCFVITKNQINIFNIDDPDQIFFEIQKLRETINNPPGTKNPQATFAQFGNSAYFLYKRLLQKGINSINDEITQLTIIPDFTLNYIPFDILLSEAIQPHTPGYAMTKVKYLMEQYTIHYQYSATLHHKNALRSNRNFEHDFVGFAPSFNNTKSLAYRDCTADELYSLQCSEKELNGINQYFSGLTFLNLDATKNSFKNAASNSRILHLATHACIDEQNANLNKIFLADDYLSNFDLFNLNLNNELAVLSACNTGSGELVKGEGVMSLAKGFINAGCSSTLMSMWSVDDCATSDIMINFYKNLNRGLRKDEALRQAKINYLSTASKTKLHPYYWAAFLPFGDMKEIELNSRTNYIYYLLPLFGIVLIWIAFSRRVKK